MDTSKFNHGHIHRPIPSSKSIAKRQRTQVSPHSKSERSPPGNHRRTGKLATLFSLSLDVWFEVVSHLLPIDLLQLARASRYFRTSLLSKSSKHIWVAARRNVPGLPDCPDDIPEPAYAHLLFDKFCDACAAPTTKTPEYSIRVRLCAACHTSNFKRGCQILREVNELRKAEIPCVAYQLVPRVAAHVYQDDSIQSESWTSYYKVELEAVAHRLVDLSQSEGECQEYVEQRKRSTSAWVALGRALYQWEQNGKQEKARERAIHTQARVESIKAKLRADGWEDKYFPVTQTEWCNIVDQPRPLNDRAWSKMYPKLKELLVAAKDTVDRQEKAAREAEMQRQLRRLYAQIMHDPARASRYGDAMPSFERFRNLASVLDLREKLLVSSCDLTSDETLAEVADDLKQWNRNTKRLLCCHLKAHLGSLCPDGNAAEADVVLARASSLFSVSCSDVPLPWPDIGPHFDHMVTRSCPAPRLARVVLGLLGYSPESTFEDVRKKGPLTCICRQGEFANQSTTSFPMLVAHCEKHHASSVASFGDFSSTLPVNQPSGGLPFSMKEITQRIMKLREHIENDEAQVARLLQHNDVDMSPEAFEQVNKLRAALAIKQPLLHRLSTIFDSASRQSVLSSSSHTTVGNPSSSSSSILPALLAPATNDTTIYHTDNLASQLIDNIWTPSSVFQEPPPG